MKKAILFLIPVVLAWACSDDPAAGTRAADRTASSPNAATPGKNPATTPMGANTPSGTVGADKSGANKATTPSSTMTPGSKPVSSDSAKVNTSTPTAPDNTKINARDRDGATLTPPDQKENETDIALTQKVRQAIIDDDTLSFAADNVKIVTQNGTVTLRGPVKDQSEKDKIESKAKAVAGVTNVDNQLEVKGS